MAIPLGQPIEEITHGLEGIKIDSHVRISEEAGKPEVQNGTDLSSPDVSTVQAYQVGHEHSGGEIAVHNCSSEAATLEMGHLGPPSELGQNFVPNLAMEYVHPGVEHIAFATEQFPHHPEQFSQHPYIGLSQVPIQGPVYTGYPAPIMNYPGNYPCYYPYPMDGVAYNNPVVNYTPVYNQNYYYSGQGAAPYNVGYTGLYGYPQYPVAPLEHYNVTAMSPPFNEEGMMVPELQVQDPAAFMPGGYQPVNPNVGHGQWVPMAMAGPPPADESVPNFNMNMVSYPADNYASGPLNQQPSLWVSPPDGPKGPNEGDETKLELEQPSKQVDSGNDSMSKSYKIFLERMDAKAPVVDNKKFAKKKQFSLMYRSMVPSWARSGHLTCMNTACPAKAYNTKSKGSAMRGLNAEPLAEPEVNLASFSMDFEDAKHFIIKSFSEENVFRSIQYGVWASTPNGNKKLDEAYRDAQARAVGKTKGCPVFLYFSVNGSGKFCGVAEMTGPVDYNTSMDFWERNRWCGSFPVKWHFIKDVPHSQLRRIILQNNENKPVTSSRDTQEVNFEQGLQMLGIIKNYSTKASILDNFSTPQRVVLEAMNTVEQPPAVENMVEANNMGDAEAYSGAQERAHEGVQQECNAAVLERSNALRASNGDAKARESHGKPKLENPNGGVTGEIGGSEADKENMMVPHVSPPAGAL